MKGRDLEKHRGNVLKERYLFQIKPFPKVTELFHRIRADNIKIVVASSATAQELRAYEKIAGIEALIEVETSSDDAEKSKPHPDIFQAAVAKLGTVPKSEIVVIGDAPYDAEAAGKAGLCTIGFRCGGFPETRAIQCVCASEARSLTLLSETRLQSGQQKRVLASQVGRSLLRRL